MNKATKKIIAKEGLTLVGVMLIALILIGASNIMTKKVYLYDPDTFRLWYDFWQQVGYLGMVILVLGYPAYLLIRFIIWAIKTVKEK